METNRQLKIGLLKDLQEYSRTVQLILSELLQRDAKAFVLSTDRSVASRALIKKLWDALPDEQYSYQFNNTGEQTEKGKAYLPQDLTQTVTMHLGWDVMCFTCSLEAAWFAWNNFNTMNTDTFNCCIYPAGLEWYIIRAGNALYPMMYSEEGYVLMNKEEN